ncbi:MAG TPA: T9SS type A sorting domain-containing protein [Bacteroidia bacterium]|jgi:hypothetical protein|nr:T9SS type A sorting domain-containing protein [Bacteroidia bacterium]
MKKIAFLLSFLCYSSIYATHNRAGEITYRHISAYTYEISVITYTKESSTLADKCQLTVKFGDGDSAVFNRLNGPLSATLCGGTIPIGEQLGNDIKKNIYRGTHTFPGPGSYVIRMEDPNRNSKICNFSGAASDQISFFLRTELLINPTLPPNNSPVLLNAPIDNGCVGECFEHNPGAFDADGDSLAYKLVPCYGNGVPIPTFQFPDGLNEHSIDAKGDIKWCSPTQICQYNIAILIEEWCLFQGKRYKVGSVLRDMQIDIGSCQNNAPTIKNIRDTSVVVNEQLNFDVVAEDVNANKLSLTATGGPFQLLPKSTFTSSDSVKTVKGTFTWKPDCSEVQLLPYQVCFKVSDNASSQVLAGYETMTIRVVAPAPQVTVSPFLNTMRVNWLPTICNDTIGKNRLEAYEIYRADSCNSWKHLQGETGVPVSSGYHYIASVPFSKVSYTDVGLTIGKYYSYVVVARYINGARSLASDGVCSLITGLKEIKEQLNITLSPNPNKGTFLLKSDAYSNSNIDVTVGNQWGQLLYTEHLFLPGNGKEFFLNLPAGTYTLRVTNEKGYSVLKFIVQ